MKKLRRNSTGGKNIIVDLKPLILLLGFLFTPLVFFIFYRVSISSERLISFSTLALISGAIIEQKKLCEKWITVFYNFLLSLILSFLVFLPGKHEDIYVFENHIQIWPYAFLFVFIMVSILMC